MRTEGSVIDLAQRRAERTARSATPTPDGALSARPGSVEELASTHATAELERLLENAKAIGDEPQAEQLRRALMLEYNQEELYAFGDRLVTYLGSVGRRAVATTWMDAGVYAWRIRVSLGEIGMPAETPGITYWVRTADEVEGLPNEYELLIDHEDGPEPTDFARRTRRRAEQTEAGLRTFEHLIVTQTALSPRD